MSGDRNSCWWTSLTELEIRNIERQLNPEGLSYGLPISWPEKILVENLRKTYYRVFPGQIPPHPLPTNATDYLAEQLNRVLTKRREDVRAEDLKSKNQKSMPKTQLYAYLNPTFPNEPAWNHVAATEEDNGVDGPMILSAVRSRPDGYMHGIPSSLRTIQKESSEKSDGATLPLAPQFGGSSPGASALMRQTRLHRSPSAPTRPGGSEIGRSVKGGSNGRNSNRRHGPESTSPNPSKRPRGAQRSPHECTQCKKTFPFPSKLRDHMHIHEAKKDFACTVGVCTKAFKRLRELQAHTKTHGDQVSVSESRDMGDGDEGMDIDVVESQADPKPPDPLREVGPLAQSIQDDRSSETSPLDETPHNDRPPTQPIPRSSPPRSTAPKELEFAANTAPEVSQRDRLERADPTLLPSPLVKPTNPGSKDDDEDMEDNGQVLKVDAEEHISRLAMGLVQGFSY